MKKLYLYVTNDEYELPIAVGRTQRELADMLGVTHHVVSLCIKRQRGRPNIKSRYKEVILDETE